MREIKILLVESQTVVRQGVCALLKQHLSLTVIGEAGNGSDGLKLARMLKPDMVLLGIRLPDLNGIDCCRMIVEEFPTTRVLALSMHSERPLIRQMFQAGASGYLLKSCDEDEMVRAIHAVCQGQKYLPAELVGSVMEDYLNPRSASGEPYPCRLTRREREILQQLTDGKSTKQVAHSLSVSTKTIETHRRNIMKKLDLHSLPELTKYAIQIGLTSLSTR
jgi:DNA-binding NarL/FixJ family response regulator